MRRRDLLLGAAVTAFGRRTGAQEAPKSAHIGFIVTGERFPRRDFDEAIAASRVGRGTQSHRRAPGDRRRP